MAHEVEESHRDDRKSIQNDIKDWTGKTVAECTTRARDRKS